MSREWWLSCPHGCYDPETCPYGQNHLVKIRALLQELEEKKRGLDDVKAEREKLLSEKSALTGRVVELTERA